MYLEAKDSSCSSAELYFGRHRCVAEPYLAHCFIRFVTAWGRAVESKLSEYDKEGKPVHDLTKLLRLNEASQPSDANGKPANQQASGHASKFKKPNPLSKEEVARRWAAQIADFGKEAGDLVSYHLAESNYRG